MKTQVQGVGSLPYPLSRGKAVACSIRTPLAAFSEKCCPSRPTKTSFKITTHLILIPYFDGLGEINSAYVSMTLTEKHYRNVSRSTSQQFVSAEGKEITEQAVTT